MVMKPSIHCVTVVVLALLSGSHIGCTVVFKPRIKPVMDYPESERLDLRVHLHFDNDFLDAEWRSKLDRTYILPVGQILKENAQLLAQSVFREVVVTEGDQERLADSVDATLIPRVVSVDRSLSVFAFGKADTVITVEWPLATTTGVVVWVATIQGKGTAMNGNNFTLHNQVRKQVQGAINDLFAKSHAAISRSPEIKAFVRARNNGHASGRSGDDN